MSLSRWCSTIIGIALFALLLVPRESLGNGDDGKCGATQRIDVTPFLIWEEGEFHVVVRGTPSSVGVFHASFFSTNPAQLPFAIDIPLILDATGQWALNGAAGIELEAIANAMGANCDVVFNISLLPSGGVTPTSLTWGLRMLRYHESTQNLPPIPSGSMNGFALPGTVTPLWPVYTAWTSTPSFLQPGIGADSVAFILARPELTGVEGVLPVH